MAKFPKLGSALGRTDYNWLLNDDEGVALAIEEEVNAGGDPDEIARFVADRLGETRQGRINRIRSAAYYLQGLKK